MRRYALATTLAGALTLTACSSDAEPTATPASTTATAVASEAANPSTTSERPSTTAVNTDVAEYWLREEREGYLVMIVAQDYTDQQLRNAFQEVRRLYKSSDVGGWHVQVDCGDSQKAEGGARQANGKFALDSLGAARTGLTVGGYEFEPLPNRASCSPAPIAASSIDMSNCSDYAGTPVPELEAVTSTFPSREHVKFVTTQTLEWKEDPSMVSAIFYICAPELDGDEFKDFATELATALQVTPYAEAVGSMSVWNFYGKETLGKIRVDRYQDYKFDGTGDPAAVRSAWREQP